MMKDVIKSKITAYYNRQISAAELRASLSEYYPERNNLVRNTFAELLESKDSKEVYYALDLLWIFEEKKDEYIDLLHTLLLEPWHSQYENLAHNLQYRKNPLSIPYLKAAMQKKYDSLESYGTGTRQFINQCGHALWSINTKEAIDTIRELSTAADPVLKDEMLYRLSRIEGRNDYERDYDLE
ncbi:hypothetical protein [Ferruginibacter sp.]